MLALARRRPLLALAAVVLVSLTMLFWNSRSATAAPAPATFTEPYLLTLDPEHNMNIVWLTPKADEGSFVEWGQSDDLGRRQSATSYVIDGMKTVDASGNYTMPLEVHQQIAVLDGLKPGTTYWYRVVTKTADGRTRGRTYHFSTAPKAGRPADFVLLSDLQLKPEITTTVRLAGQQKADFIVYNGDLVNTPAKAGEWFTVAGTTEPDDKRWFNVMQQTGGGAELLQYHPIFPSPGNHEIDQQNRLADPALASRNDLSMQVYMQLFRPLYPAQQYGVGGTHWYSADFGDVHVVSLSIIRAFGYPSTVAPGWFLFDDIKAGSKQYNWLSRDLKASKDAKCTWVTQHWHMYNMGHETDVPFTDPVATAGGTVTYPAAQDYLQRDIKPLFERYGVDGVSFGHSHVYERYLLGGVNYVEASTIGNTYETPTDAPDPNAGLPIVRQNSFRSFMKISGDRYRGFIGQGFQASMPSPAVGFVGRVFDRFVVTPGMGAGED